MHRGSIRDFAGKAMHTLARATINSIKDNPMMQEMHADFFNNDSRKGIERVQNYGFTSSIIPRSKSEGSQQKQTGATGQNVSPEQPKGEAAEAVMLFQGGQRNHPLAIAVDDRRHRPRIFKPGESAQYDDIGQMTLLRRNGAYLISVDNEDYDGKKEERMASLRHVEKKKQERPKQQAGSSGQSQGDQQEEDYKHEGEEVNTEIRCKKKTIEILDGEDVIAVYSKEDKSWTFQNMKKFKVETEEEITLECQADVTVHGAGTVNVHADGVCDIVGHPIKFNGGGPSVPPFQVP